MAPVTDVDTSKRMVRVEDGLADDGANPHKNRLALLGRARGLRLPLARDQDASGQSQAVTVIAPSGCRRPALSFRPLNRRQPEAQHSDDDYVRVNTTARRRG